MTRALMLVVATLLAAIFFYVSRFWDFALWARPGLLGWDQLPPQGGLVARWLRGTDAAPFELLIWAVGCFLVLTFAQKIFDRLTRGKE
ncbi:MAG: hypothetical protein AB8B58_15190 [Roseobacter sp.]